MPSFEIFKSGKQTSSAGSTIDFSESDLQKTVEAYDPSLHEAPIVVGHPKDNLPAYGWVSKIDFSDGILNADAIQVDEDFSEMVRAGRFKKRSASFYSPDSPSNPVPGVYYLRHVAFLGAEPPAVKGLKDVNFSEDEEGIVEFSDSYMVAGIFRRLREFIISKFSKEDADEVVPSYLVESLEEEARRESDSNLPTSFNEGADDMTLEELKAENDQLKTANQKLQSDMDQMKNDFSERESKLAQREEALERKEVEAKIDEFVEAGKVVPAEKQNTVDIALGLSVEKNIDFGEGDNKTKISKREQFFNLLSNQKGKVDFSEHSESEDEEIKKICDQEVADKAREKVQTAQDGGRTLSFSEAVRQTREELGINKG